MDLKEWSQMSKKHRITLDLPESAMHALDEVVRVTGRSKAAVLRAGLSLFCQYILTDSGGGRFEVVSPDGKDRSALKILF